MRRSAAQAPALVALALAALAATTARAQVSLPLTFLEGDHLAWFLPAVMGGTTLQMLFDTGSVPLVTLNTTGTGYQASSCSSNTFSIAYGSGTVAGDVCSGNVQLASATATNQQTLVSKYDKAASGQSNEVFDMNGIMGWGPSSSSTFGTLYSQGQVPSPVFSTYLPLSAAGATGELTAGGINAARYTGDLTFVTISPNTCTDANTASSCLVPSVPAGSYPYWMLTGLKVYLESGSGAATLLCADCTGIADTGTSSVVGPDAVIRQVQEGYGVGLSSSSCAAALIFTLPGGGRNVTVELNKAGGGGRGCTPVVPKALFSSNSGVSSIFGDPSTSFILGAPFVSASYMVWDLGSTSAGPRLGFADPVAGSFVAPPPVPQPPSPPPAPPSSSSGLSTGAIVGIVVGSVAGGLLLLGLLAWCLCFRRSGSAYSTSEAEALRRQMARPLAEGRQHVAMASLQARAAWPAASPAVGGGVAVPPPAATRPAAPSPLYQYGPQVVIPAASAYAPRHSANMV